MSHLVRIGIGVLSLTLVTAAASPSFAADPPKKKAVAKKPSKKPVAKKVAPAPEPDPEPAVEEIPPPAKASPSPSIGVSPAKGSKDAASAAPDTDEEEAAQKRISVAPELGYATASLKLGLGIRGGYTMQNRIYVGGAFVYHFGASEEGETLGGKVESSVSFFYTGAEVGYEIPAGPVLVRPYGGVGAMFATISMKGGGEATSDSSSSIAFWPGCTVTYRIPRSSFYVGGDTKLVIATEGGDASLGLFATGGMRF